MSIVPGSSQFVEIVTELLSLGYRVRFRAEGASMRPTIRGGEKITAEPISEVKMGDIALYRAERGLIAHRVVGVRKENDKAPVFLTRGDAIGSPVETVLENRVLGKVIAVERNRQSIDLRGRWANARCRAGRIACVARHWGAALTGLHRARVFLLVFALVAVFPNSAHSNIAVTAQNATAASGTSCTFSLNTNAVAQGASTVTPNLVLISVEDASADTSGATVTISPPTVTATLVFNTGTGEGVWQVMGFTPSASSTITITGLPSSTGFICGASAFSGVSRAPVRTDAGNSIGTVSVTNPGTGGVVFSETGVTAGPSPTIPPVVTPTAPAGQAVQWTVQSANASGAVTVGTAAVAPPTSSVTWTATNTFSGPNIIAVPLFPLVTTEVQSASFTVTQHLVRNQIENVVQLDTGREVNSLGFNLYREQNGQRVKLNSSLLAGTALLAGNAILTAGHVHTWWDAPAGGNSATYWVEEVDLHGQRTWYGPATPAAASPGSTVNSTMLTKDAAGQVVYLSEVGEPGTGVMSTSHPLHARAVHRKAISLTTEKEYALAAGPGVKIGVQSEGWYRVPWANLVAAGLDPNADANSLQLYAEGVEQPILVQGRVGNKLGPQSNIEFYGTGLDTTWSDTRIYWLTWGKQSGLRVHTEALQARAIAGASSFPFTVEWMPRTVYFAALLSGDGSNNFFGPVLESGDPVSQAITITNLAGNAAEAQMRVTLQGVSETSHSVEVALNGHQLGTVTFSNQTEGVETVAVPAAALLNGQNQLTLTVDGGDEDVSTVDNVELTYPHSYTADADSLRFTALSGRAETIRGFSNSQISVVDITNPEAVTLLHGTITHQGEDYAVTVEPHGAGTRTLLAFTSAQDALPASIISHHPSSWHAQAGYDMVMISHANFAQSLRPLVTLHQGQGLKTAIIDVEGLYDEFNYGEKNPNALKDFLSTAKVQWQVKPRFVMLVGDATFDPRNYLGFGNFDFVPTYLVDTALLQTASDDWYADFNGKGIPQMAIGRLPVRTAQEAAALVSKIVNYDQSGDAAWKQQVLLVADQNDSQNNFEGDAAAVKALLPGSLTVSEISPLDSGSSEALLNSLDQGEAMVDYVGHGSESVWANSLFSSTDANSLTNGSMVPFVVSMTCLNGYFQDVYATALAKALMEAPGGGALAVWASSGLTDSGDQAAVNQALIKAIFGAQPMTIGEAAAIAKSATTSLDVRRTWILFGDPATKLQ